MSEVEKMTFFGETKPISPLKWSKEFEYSDRIYYISYTDEVDYSDPQPLESVLVLGQRHVKLALSPDLSEIFYSDFSRAPIEDKVYSVSHSVIETGILSYGRYTMFNERNMDCDEYSTHVSVGLLCSLLVAFSKAKLSVKLLSQNAEVIENYVNEHIKYYNIDCGCSDYAFSYKRAVNFLLGE